MSDYILIPLRRSNKTRTEGRKRAILRAIENYERSVELRKEYSETISFVVDDSEEDIKVYPASIEEAYDFGRYMLSWELSFDLHRDVRR